MCQSRSHRFSLLTQLLSPCCPMICLVVLGRYLSTHIRLHDPTHTHSHTHTHTQSHSHTPTRTNSKQTKRRLSSSSSEQSSSSSTALLTNSSSFYSPKACAVSLGRVTKEPHPPTTPTSSCPSSSQASMTPTTPRVAMETDEGMYTISMLL